MPEETAAIEASPVISPFEFDVGVVAKLGVEAKSAEVSMVKAPQGMLGVPSEIPVALYRGESPSVETLATLFEPYRLHPSRKTGQAEVQTFEAFTNLVNRHKTADSVIFADADWRKPSFTAIVDYHEDKSGGLAGNGKHRVHYAFPLSEEWKKWIEGDGQPMKQEAFAWFLEDRVAELSSPEDHEKVTYEAQFATTIATPAQLVELSRGLQVRVDAKIKATHTLQSGEGQISWEETHNGSDGKPLKVPGLFMLNIAPFFMGEKVRIPVRLRYRPQNGAVTWFYQIYRPDLHITEHVRSTLAEARAKTELPTFEDRPEMSAS
jgi:uncharacterized protein YfdQ (DUF2303 family)